MEKEFPQWLMDISLLLQTENVQVAFYRIRPQTPEVLRPAVDDMLEELLDRFGEPGKAVLNLLAIAKLKAIAHQGYVTEIKQTGKTVRFTLYEKARLNPVGFPALMQKYRRGLQFKNEQEPKFILEPQGNLILALTEFAEELKSMAENM